MTRENNRWHLPDCIALFLERFRTNAQGLRLRVMPEWFQGLIPLEREASRCLEESWP